MKENMEDYGDQLTENQKQIAGRKLFGEIENLSLPIRSNVPDPFIMRGTYLELAYRLVVGWHVDFMERLCELLRR